MLNKKPKGNRLIADVRRRAWARQWQDVGYYKNRPHLIKGWGGSFFSIRYIESPVGTSK